MAKKQLVDDFVRDIKQYASNIAKFTATAIRDDLYKTAYDAIVTFYDDYQPKSYNRHYYNFLNKSFKKYYHNNHDTKYSGGIILSAEWMDDIYRASERSDLGTEFVFDLVYEGYHGWDTGWTVPSEPVTNGFGERMQPSPLDLIEKRYNYISRHINKYINNAEAKARALRKYK